MSMNSQTLGLRVAGFIFGIMCLGHIWRFFANVDVQVGSHHLPMWGSVVAMIVGGGLSLAAATFIAGAAVETVQTDIGQ